MRRSWRSGFGTNGERRACFAAGGEPRRTPFDAGEQCDALLRPLQIVLPVRCWCVLRQRGEWWVGAASEICESAVWFSVFCNCDVTHMALIDSHRTPRLCCAARSPNADFPPRTCMHSYFYMHTHIYTLRFVVACRFFVSVCASAALCSARDSAPPCCCCRRRRRRLKTGPVRPCLRPSNLRSGLPAPGRLGGAGGRRGGCLRGRGGDLPRRGRKRCSDRAGEDGRSARGRRRGWGGRGWSRKDTQHVVPGGI